MLRSPLFLEFGWGEIAQRRVDALVHVHVVEKATWLAVGLMVVQVLGQVNFLFLDGPDEPARCPGGDRSGVPYRGGGQRITGCLRLLAGGKPAGGLGYVGSTRPAAQPPWAKHTSVRSNC